MDTVIRTFAPDEDGKTARRQDGKQENTPIADS
jgi:hypothetical protein